MFKHLLFASLLAFLATSCGGGHITTTPVVKNAPSAPLSAPTKKNLIAPTGYNDNFGFNITITAPASDGLIAYYLIDGTSAPTGNIPEPTLRCSYSTGYDNSYYLYISNRLICLSDYISNIEVNNCSYNPTDERGFGRFLHATNDNWPMTITGVFHFKPAEHAYQNGYDNGEQAGYQEGRADGFSSGYEDGYNDGMEDVYNVETNRLIPNGQYTGLSIFPKRNYLENLATRVVSGLQQLPSGEFYLIDTNGNYTIYIKWSYSYPKTTFQTTGNQVIGELYWTDIISANWSTSWFYLYDPELHYFTQPKTYATNAPIETSFYPEVYIGSTFTGGDANLYFSGGGNAYQMGFADGQTYTIQASETYNNVFTIFTPAFRAVANFFNLNIGPFKLWYFFAIPLIVSLLILVLRLVKH